MVAVLHELICSQEKHFPDADKFIPERWIKGHPLETSSHPYASLPFGFGTRACIGRRLAEAEIWLLVIKLLQNFRIEYDHDDIGVAFHFINTPDQPLRFKFTDLQ